MGKKDAARRVTIARQERISAELARQHQWATNALEALLKESIPQNLAEALQDGVFLCRLMNVYKSGAIKKFNTAPKTPFKMMENCNLVLAASKELGITAQFVASDVVDKNNLGRVLDFVLNVANRAGYVTPLEANTTKSEEYTRPSHRQEFSEVDSTNNNTRTNIVSDFLESEREYIKDMEALITSFMNPLRGILSPDCFFMIFHGIDNAVSSSKFFLSSVQGGNINHIGEPLKKYVCIGPISSSDILKCEALGNFPLNQEDALLVIEQQKQVNPMFDAFLKKSEMFSENTTLSQSLLKPLMRIGTLVKIGGFKSNLVKYNNMVKELERNTGPSHPDHVILGWVKIAIKPVADRASMAWKKTENARKLLSIQNSIASLPDNFQIYKSDRVYVREADLIKYSKGKANNRHFFLFNDCVVYTILATSLLKKSSTKYVFKGNWEHNQSIVEDITDTRDIKFAFAVTNKKRRIIGGLNLNQKKSWMADITKFVTASQKAEAPRPVMQDTQVTSIAFTEPQAADREPVIHPDHGLGNYLRANSEQPPDEKRKTVNLQFIFSGVAPALEPTEAPASETHPLSQAERRKTVNLEFIKKEHIAHGTSDIGEYHTKVTVTPEETREPQEEHAVIVPNMQVRGVDSEIVAIGDELESILDDLNFSNDKIVENKLQTESNPPTAAGSYTPIMEPILPATAIESAGVDLEDWKAGVMETITNELRKTQGQLLSTQHELEREVQKRKKLKTLVRAAEKRISDIEQVLQR